MKKTPYRVIFVLTLICSFNAVANDTHMGSVGGNIYPSKSNSIQMVKERINAVMYHDSFTVSCKFWFYNLEKPEYINVGFPDAVNNSDSPAADTLRNFKVIINGKPEEITRVKQISTGYNHETLTNTEYWFTWKMHFPSKETVFVENYYTGSYSHNAGGLYFVSYIIGTGSTWQGSIKDGRVVFNHSNLATNYFINDTFPGYTNIKPAYYQDSVVYAFTKYRPKESEILIVELYPYWANSNIYEFKKYLEKNNYTKKELRLIRNEIFARRGYVFNDKSLNKYFTSKKWYKPNNNFKASMLNEYEQNMINYLSQLEKEANI